MLHPSLAGHLPLSDMIQQTITSAREKLAAAEEKEEKKESKEHESKEKKMPFGEKKKEEAKEKNSSAILDCTDVSEMDKLASALEEMAEELIKESDSIENGGESKQGGEQLATMSPVGGKQNYKRDSAKHQVPTSTGLQAAKDDKGASTAVPTDDNRAPGGTGAKYPAKGVLKTAAEKLAFSISESGHKLDAAEFKADAEAAHTKAKGQKEYSEKRPGLAGAATAAPFLRFGPHTRASHATRLVDRISNRLNDHAAKKHEGGKNSYNPLGGLLTKSRQEEKEKKSSVGRLQDALEKMAFSVTEEGHKLDVAHEGSDAKKSYDKAKALEQHSKDNPLSAHFFGSGTRATANRLQGRSHAYAEKKHSEGKNAYNPFGGMLTKNKYEGKDKKSAADFILDKVAEFHGGGETLDSKSGEGPKPPSQPGRQLIANNAAVTNAKKVDAKSPRKAELSQVLTEPAMTKSTDSKVQDNLRNAAKGGVKIAEAAKEALQKIASDPNDPRHEALKDAIAKRKAEKGEKKESEKEEKDS